MVLVVDGIDSDVELERKTLGLVEAVELAGKYKIMDVPQCGHCRGMMGCVLTE